MVSTGLAGQGPGDVTYSGCIVDGQGKPLEGAEVRLCTITQQRQGRPEEVNLAGQVTTQSDGSFRFSLPSRGQDGPYRYSTILAKKPGLAWGWISWETDKDGRGEIPLIEPKDLKGQVIDEQGNPVADAEVTLALATTGKGDTRFVENPGWMLTEPVARQVIVSKSDAAGRFQLKDLPADATCELLVAKSGSASLSTLDWSSYRMGKLRYTPLQSDIKVTLPKETFVRGMVVEKATGKAVPDIDVVLFQGHRLAWRQGPVRSADDGSFALNGLAPGKCSLELVPVEQGTAAWVAEPVSIELRGGQAKADVRVELTKGGLLEVAVKEAGSGRPITGASVGVSSSTEGRRYVSGKTDDNGIAVLRLLPGGYRMSGPFKAGYSAEMGERTVTIQDGQTERTEVSLKAQPKVTGVIRDPEGIPLAGVELQVMPAGRESVTSDSQGWFELAWDPGFWGERDTTFCLVARQSAKNLALAAQIGPDSRDLDLRLRPATTFTGQVVDPNGRGIAGAGIRVMLNLSNWGSPLDQSPVQTDAHGRFEVKAIPPDNHYRVYASANGFGRSELDVGEGQLVASGPLDVGRIQLPLANLSVSGHVVDTQGNAVADASIEAHGFDSGQPERLITKADPNGSFKLAGVCAGQVNIQANAIVAGKRMSGRVVTEGGAAGIRIVVTEGQSPVRYIRTKTREQIVKPGSRFITGQAVDEKGRPVADIPVGVCCRKTYPDGKPRWSFGGTMNLADVTDDQGRFVIELKEDGEYNLLFSPRYQAAIIVYDVPVGQQDLKVTLPDGGTILGRLVRMEQGKKTPIPNSEVTVEQPNRASFTHLGFDKDRKVMTDAQGRFRVEHLCTEIRTDYAKPEYGPRFWAVKYGEVSQTVSFGDGVTTAEVELVVKPSPKESVSLVGRPMPSFDGIKIDLDQAAAKDKRVLVCFFDMEQRPSRQAILRLSGRAATLSEKGVVAFGVDLSKAEASTRSQWITEQKIQIPIGVAEGDSDEIRATWGVKALPWLILTDKDRKVTADGFAVSDLDKVLNR